MSALFSIGYATKAIETFIAHLHAHGIDVVADVRSVPYSKAFHDYHRENLIEHLRKAGIRYVYLGEELGPRSPCDAHYENGQVQFDRLQRSSAFLRGVERLLDGFNKGFSIALTCAEKDPAVCHRSLLIAHFLKREHGLDIAHINHGGELESESALSRRLMDETGIVPDMLTGEEECLENSWREQSRRCDYKKPD